MRSKYDLSKGERGKFFQPNVQVRLPVYLNIDVQAYLTNRAAEEGIPLGDMVNNLLRHEIAIMKSAK